jgi:CrcB protein
VINVTGAFLIGLIIAFAVKNQRVDSSLLLLLKVGFCGGFTTFSTFSLETTELFQNGKYFIALSYIALSVILSIAAVFGAQALVK